MNRSWNYLVLAASLVVGLSAWAAPEPRIRNWEFEWTVLEAGKAKFAVVRTQDTSYVTLTSDYDRVRLTTQQAEEVAALLADADARLEALKARANQPSEKATDSVKTKSGATVGFAYDVRFGGRIWVSGGGYSISHVTLSGSQAEVLAEKMANATELAEIVARRVNPNP